jgi:hypothetical protein
MILKGSYRERFCMGDSHRCYLYSHSYDASPPEFQGASDYQSGIRGSFRSSERVNGLHSMTKQRIHDHLGTLEIATPDDINEVMAHRFDAYLRDRYRTIKVMKLPQIRFTATGTTVTLAQSPSSGPPVGPEQGFMWDLRRVIVASSVLADTGKYVLYAGSDPTVLDASHLLEGFATGGQPVNQGYYPASDSAWLWPGEQIYAAITGATIGNQYVLSGVAVEAAAEMVAKLVG